MSQSALMERTDRPSYVRFERVAIENKIASIEQGRYVAKDVDFALITPPYSKDVIRIKVSQWMLNMEQDVRNDRMPAKWMDSHKEAYRLWQNGQEIPLNGTPIRGWGVVSPAQQETLLRLNILTVEDLAHVNDEGLRRIGMGAMELKNKAKGWLAQLEDKGPLTIELAALKQENAILRSSLESMQAQINALGKQSAPEPEPESSVSDLLDEPPVVRRKRSA